MVNYIKKVFLHSSGRSKEAVKGVALSVLAKLVYVISSFLIVHLTIDYVNPTQYGIWLTLSSIVGWVVLFDLGLGNGFRNRFAEAKADGNAELAKSYLSTTYLFSNTINKLLSFPKYFLLYYYVNHKCFISHYLNWVMI